MHTKKLPTAIATTFIISFTCMISSSNGSVNANYTVCSTLYSCGSITNIGYPFWGGDRPEFCGHPEFRLDCYDGRTVHHPYIYVPSLGKAEVLSISTSSHEMTVVQEPFSYSLPYCRTMDERKPDFPADSKFKFSAGVADSLITLFRSCSDSVLTYQHNSFTCLDTDEGRNESVLYFGKMSEVIEKEAKSYCKVNLTFPVLKRELNELNSGKATLLGVLRKGFEMEYVVNFTACSACQSSGGSCGSSDSQSSSSVFMCYCPDGPQLLSCPKSEKPKLRLILGLGITGVIILLAAIAIFWYRKNLNFGHKRSVSMSASIDRTTSDVEKGTIYFGVPLFSYTELKEATDNFQESNELGDGGFGTVYYGKLKDGREVAVKRLYEKSYKRVEQFMNEVEILTRLRHHNLVSLYGCTSHHSKELLLVYEYVPNGTVADHLQGDKAKPGSLPWHMRLNIAIETATALAYLHASDIIHRDVKTNNILLDNSFHVKVADFGLSRLFPNDVTHVSTAPQGTPGYLDPEYHQCYQLTDKSDVYSFGVVLVELISSLPAVDMERHRQEINLSNYAMSRIQRCAFNELVDPQLGFMSDFKVRRMTTSVAELAFQCLQHDKEFRPSMDEVLESLKRIERANYEELKAEEEAKNKKTTIQFTMPPPSPSENDEANLLSHHQVYPPSPDSVMDKWGSRLTTPSTSK